MADNQDLNNPYLPAVPPLNKNNAGSEPAPFSPYGIQPPQPNHENPQPLAYGPPSVNPAPYGTPQQSYGPPQMPMPQHGYEQQYLPQQGYAQPQPNYMQAVKAPSNNLALIGFILGLAAIILGLLGSLPAIVLGHIALYQMKTKPAGNRWQAITALWLGYVGVGLYILLIMLVFGLQGISDY